MCIRDSPVTEGVGADGCVVGKPIDAATIGPAALPVQGHGPVSYTHLRAHETVLDLVCRLLLEKTHNYKSKY